MEKKDIKTIDDVKAKISTLELEEDKKNQILELVGEFEAELSKGRDGNKLRKIMVEISAVNVRAGAALFDYSDNTGLLSRMVS